ncbi:MAG: hypothetical protein WAZ14_01480 [Patescibacteria group bacterium]
MENFQKEWKSFKLDLMQSMHDAFRDNNELIFQEIRATKTELRRELIQGLRTTKIDLISEITDFIGDRLLPQLDDHERRLVKLEAKII